MNVHFALNDAGLVPPLARLEPRTRLDEVAREAGVSLATVDRALHQRPGVSTRTLLRVQQALQRLAAAREPAPARQRQWLLCVLLPAGEDGFVNLLRAELAALMPWLAAQGTRLDVRTTDTLAPAAAAAAVKRLRGQYDGVVLMLQDHPLVQDAVGRLAADGTCVVSLMSRIATRQRAHFVGMDNAAAGRTAADLLARFAQQRAGAVGLVMGSGPQADEAERLRGFRERMAAQHPALTLLEPLDCGDRNELAEAGVAQWLGRHPELVGLYSVGGGHGGVHAALRTAGRSGQLAWVCHGLTAEARAALMDGSASAVIAPSAAQQARAACRVALSQLARRPAMQEEEPAGFEVHLCSDGA